MKHIFILNPAAGKKDCSPEISAELRRLSLDMALDYSTYVTARPAHATEIVHEVMAGETGGGTIRFYACGGDGTLNEVARAAAGYERAEVTNYPCGTGNDFIKIFGDGASRFYSLKELISGTPLSVDMLDTSSGGAVNIVSVGFDARVARAMHKYKRIPFLKNRGPYMLSVVENIFRGLGTDYRVKIDGEDKSGCYTIILAANGRCYGGGFYAVPDADPSDGLIDFLLIKKVTPLTVARVINIYAAGRYRELPGLISWQRGHTLEVEETKGNPFPLNLDGEIREARSLKLSVSEKKLKFSVPDGVRLKREKLG